MYIYFMDRTVIIKIREITCQPWLRFTRTEKITPCLIYWLWHIRYQYTIFNLYKFRFTFKFVYLSFLFCKYMYVGVDKRKLQNKTITISVYFIFPWISWALMRILLSWRMGWSYQAMNHHQSSPSGGMQELKQTSHALCAWGSDLIKPAHAELIKNQNHFIAVWNIKQLQE